MTQKKIFVVMPAYKSSGQIINVINQFDFSIIEMLIVIDDNCPEKTGNLVKNTFDNKKILVIQNLENLGVGGATKVGFYKSIEFGATHIIKIDSDGQMDPKNIYKFISAIKDDDFDYVKGNRFLKKRFYNKMPLIRLLGNLILSIITKISSGYYSISDPTNGFIMISSKAFLKINFKKINDGFFFESDIINKLWYIKGEIFEIPVETSYGDEVSNLKIHKIILTFIYLHLINFINRIIYKLNEKFKYIRTK